MSTPPSVTIAADRGPMDPHRTSSLSDDESRSFAMPPRGGEKAPPSISSQLRRSLLIRLGIVFVVCALAFYLFLRTSLVSYYDATTLSKVRALESVVSLVTDDSGAPVTVNFAELRRAMPEFERGREPEYFQFWAIPNGTTRVDAETLKVLSRSPTLDRTDGPGEPGLRGQRGVDMPIRIPSVNGATAAAGEIMGAVTGDVTLPDGRAGRCTWVVFTPASAAHPLSDGTEQEQGKHASRVEAGAPRLLVAVARARTRLDHSLRMIALGLIGMGLVGGLVVRLSVRSTVERAMGPVNRLAAVMAALDERRLPRRLDVSALPLEIEPVRERLDDLLGRIAAQSEGTPAKAGTPAEHPPASGSG